MELTLEDRVRAVIAEELARPAADLASDATLHGDLGADSMDSYNLVLALEAEFGIEIAEHDIPNLRTVRQVVHYVREKTGVGDWEAAG
jgi:acyl carrier protein